jgi:predicted nuclease of predicted toxin-antitoxin system
MRFLADMGVDRRIVHWLQQNGDDTIHLRDQGLQKLPDLDIFDKAHLERRGLARR